MIASFPTNQIISTASLEAIGAVLGNVSLALAGGVDLINPVTSTAYFIPFWVGHPISVTQVFCYNGTVVQGSIDVGIYDEDGGYIISAGSTTQSGVSDIQSFVLSPNRIIGPGRFYLAVSLSNTQGRFIAWAWPTTTLGTMAGMQYLFNTFPLPTTGVTFTNLTTTSAALPFKALTYIPLIGLSTNVVSP